MRSSVEESSKNVLIIDDSWVVLEGLRMTLAGAGYQVRLASNEATAFKHVPWAELVIVDFHMPEADGAALLPRLKSHVREKATCFFYLCTSDAEIARTYAKLGFEGGFLKKGDGAALLPQVEAAFRTIKLRQLAASLRSSRTGSKPPK